MRKLFAFTLIELLVVISIIALLIGILLPALGAARKTANQMKNSTQIRGQHQSCVIYAQNNNSYLPGLSTDGTTGLTNAFGSGGGGGGGGSFVDGSTVGYRYSLLLASSLISPQLMINPQDSGITVWSSNVPSTNNYSYDMLCITTTANDSGRQAEWRDNANASAILISDRNIVSFATAQNDANEKSVWTTTSGTWTGSAVFGDNHAIFLQSNRVTTTTIYNAVQTTNDNLFVSTMTNNAADNSSDSTANCYMVNWN